jgi:hypothetical protein
MNMNRQQYNKEILRDLEVLIEKYPDQRFGQIIANYVFPNYQHRDFFFEEPSETLKIIGNHVPAQKEK